MLKLFLVEDEVVVREGIKKKIHWEEYGFTFVGEAADGELAYARIQQARPDVVITDIRMPFMDGLQLARLIHQDMPWVKIIILTGYDDFKYAQEAISIGVIDYLLKPVSRQQIIDTIIRVRDLIEGEHKQKEFVQRFKEEMLEKEHLEHQHFFGRLVSGKTPLPELLSAAKELGLVLSAENYTILLFRFVRVQQGAEPESYSDTLAALEDEVEHLFDLVEGALLFLRGVEGYALLAKGGADTPSEELAKSCAENLGRLFGRQSGIQYYIGIGRQVDRLQEVQDSYESASRALAHQYVLGDDREDLVEAMQEPHYSFSGQGFRLETLNLSALDQQVVERFLKSGSLGNEEYLINDLFASIGDEHIQSLLLRQYVAMSVYFAALSFVEKLGLSKEMFIERCGDIGKLGERLAGVESTREYLIKVIREALRARDEKSLRRHGSMLQKAQEYIDEHYSEEGISLKVVARAVNVSPAHFSAMFSQEMGRTFIEYLTSRRIEKAKELLACTSLKSSEIAYETGYKDPHYFSFLFKKLTGRTPREFRAEKREES